MQITEIYRSLQGESSFAGLPCIFVRLTACNLRCSWCDSEYTFSGGRKMSHDEVMSAVRALTATHPPVPPETNGDAASGPATSAGSALVGDGTKLVEITGGEPMLQERELIPLMRALLAEGYTVLLETSGERPLAAVPIEVIKIVDVKCPASGEAGSFRQENLTALTSRDELKFVLADRGDYEFARNFIRQHQLEAMGGRIIFSPAFRKDARGERSSSQCLLDPQPLAEWILADRLSVRLGLQIHKYIWQPEVKGV